MGKGSIVHFNLRKIKSNRGSISNMFAHVFGEIGGYYLEAFIFGKGHVILPMSDFI